jgi:hypothetical protein
MIVALFWGLFGFLVLSGGIAHLTGRFKRWFTGPRIYPPQAILYGSIPLGVASIVLSAAVGLSQRLGPRATETMVLWGALPLTLLGFVLAIWRPRWTKPKWILWLEENYGDRIHILWGAARRDPNAWARRVATQEGLEEWAREVAGEPRPAKKREMG